MHYYEVAPIGKVIGKDPTLTYHSEASLQPGSLHRITVGTRQFNGVVISETSKPSYDTKAIGESVTPIMVPNALLHLAEWMSSYYLTPQPVVWQTMLPRGLEKTRRKTIEPQQNPKPTALPKLSSEQTAALKTLRQQPASTHVLQGVTGSGKTMVYIQRAKELLETGKSSIILVPEIGLTRQLIQAFSEHLSPVFVTHSRMSEAERHSAWKAIAEHTEPCVIVGPRSALFSPRSDIGLIVIDEFHEPSYKQEQNPKYATVRAAAQLARQHDAQLVLGSATPSISEQYLAEAKAGSIIHMTKPVKKAASADVKIVDMKNESNQHKGWLSNTAKQALGAALQRKQQALIFHNRRGSASTSLCERCGWIAECPNCYLPLTLHADWHQLRCHICDHKEAPPRFCPDCKHPDLVFKGLGTKQLAADLQSLFPGARIARFDTDNSKEQSLEQRYDELRAGEIDFIVGTQTIAKGLDLPKLNVVLVPLADVGLFIPDYTASERTFQLLYQVIGRVGRHDDTGQVLIQTYSPDHNAIQLASNRDIKTFYETEIQQRRLAKYPPFVHMMKVTAEYASAAAARSGLNRTKRDLGTRFGGLQILGPAPAFHERFHDRYRWQIVIKSRSRNKLLEIADAIPARFTIDIDPSNLL